MGIWKIYLFNDKDKMQKKQIMRMRKGWVKSIQFDIRYEQEYTHKGEEKRVKKKVQKEEDRKDMGGQKKEMK